MAILLLFLLHQWYEHKGRLVGQEEGMSLPESIERVHPSGKRQSATGGLLECKERCPFPASH